MYLKNKILCLCCIFLFIGAIFANHIDFNTLEQCENATGNPLFEYHMVVKHFKANDCGLNGEKCIDLPKMLNLILGKNIPAIKSEMVNQCRIAKQWIENYKNYLNEYRVCFNNVDHEEILNSIANAPTKANSFIDWFCLNDSQNVIDFTNNELLQCTKTKSHWLAYCIESGKSSYGVSAIEWPNFKPTKGLELSFELFKLCTTDAVEECKNANATNSMKEMLKAFDVEALLLLLFNTEYKPVFTAAQIKGDYNCRFWSNLRQAYQNDSDTKLLQMLDTFIYECNTLPIQRHPNPNII